MRAVFGLLGLVVVLALVGLLVKKNLRSTQESLARQVPSLPAGHNQAPEPSNVREQSLQAQQQYRKQLESALSAQRPEPEQAP